MNIKNRNNKKFRFVVWMFSPFVYMWAMLVLAKTVKAAVIAVNERELWI